jgi:hypothetical protein
MIDRKGRRTDEALESRRGRIESSPAIYRWEPAVVLDQESRRDDRIQMLSVVPSGLGYSFRSVPSHEWLGYYQLSLTGQKRLNDDPRDDERARGEVAIKDLKSGDQRSAIGEAHGCRQRVTEPRAVASGTRTQVSRKQLIVMSDHDAGRLRV